MIAEMLNLPFINACNGLEISRINKQFNKRNRWRKRINHLSSCPLVIGGQKGLSRRI